MITRWEMLYHRDIYQVILLEEIFKLGKNKVNTTTYACNSKTQVYHELKEQNEKLEKNGCIVCLVTYCLNTGTSHSNIFEEMKR